jgi:hypothetical protein
MVEDCFPVTLSSNVANFAAIVMTIKAKNGSDCVANLLFVNEGCYRIDMLSLYPIKFAFGDQ